MSFTFRNLKPYSARMALYTLLVVLSVVFTMSTALSVADFLKILFGENESQMPSVNLVAQALSGLYEWLITFGRKEALILFSVIIFVLYSLKNIFGYLAAIQVAVIRTGVVRNLRNSLFRKAMRLPLSYHDRARKGDVMARFSSDMVEYEESVLGSLQSLLSSTISMVLYLAMLVYLNVKLTLFVLLMLPLVALVVAGLARRLKRNSQEVQEMNSRLISITDETMGGLKVIKSYNAIDFSNHRFRQYNREYTRKRNAMYRRIDAASPVSEFLGSVIVICILLFGSWLVMNGDNGLTADLFISYVMLFVLMIPPAKDLTTAFSQMRKGRACAERIEEFLGEEEEKWKMESGKQKVESEKQGETAVELRHVNFSYNEGVQVLHDINISVPRGTTLALVGASGSGKSTIADLICRFYEIIDGQILLDGEPIDAMTLTELRSSIGVVAQDTLLFNDTVADNIAFGRPEASQEEIENAARAAQAHEFIITLPQGYQTNIGEGGGMLSGGQRQRISIARALLRNPKLLILDEATSALDTENERLLQSTLGEVLKGRTAIVIAHRLSTVAGADNIVVLDHGRIVEQGSHDELMALGGRYKQMVLLQSLD